jgi:hypothetical protein
VVNTVASVSLDFGGLTAVAMTLMRTMRATGAATQNHQRRQTGFWVSPRGPDGGAPAGAAAAVAGAKLGSYQRPSDASHQPGPIGVSALVGRGGAGCGAACGGYQRPSDASHQPGPCEVSLNLPPVPPPYRDHPDVVGESVPWAAAAVHSHRSGRRQLRPGTRRGSSRPAHDRLPPARAVDDLKPWPLNRPQWQAGTREPRPATRPPTSSPITTSADRYRDCRPCGWPNLNRSGTL